MIGLHLDLKWSMYRKEYFENILNIAVSLGIDTILLEFENKLSIDRLKPAIHPEAWTKANLRAFLRSCRQKKMTVIPAIPTMGHMEWILQWPWWSHLQENNDRHEICPLHPETPAFLQKYLDEILSLFPDAPAIHIGGDETYSLGSCPRCRTCGKSRSQLYLSHYLPLIRQVERSGKRAIIYGDMILAHPEIIPDIPRSTIICDWDYWSGTGESRVIWGYRHGITRANQLKALPKHLQMYSRYLTHRQGRLIDFPYAAFLKNQGFDVILGSSARCAGDNYCAPRTLYHVRNAHAAARQVHELGLTGTIVTSWAPRFNHLNTNWPAIAAGAWTYHNPKLNISELSERFARDFFGCNWPECFFDLDKLSPILPDIAYTGLNGEDPYPPDILHRFISRIYRDPNGPAVRAVRKTLPDVKRSYRHGLSRLQHYQPTIKQHRDVFEHWLLASLTLVHKADAVPSLIKIAQGNNITLRVRKKMLDEVKNLMSRHKEILNNTHLPISQKMEINLRFAEELELLTSAEERVCYAWTP